MTEKTICPFFVFVEEPFSCWPWAIVFSSHRRWTLKVIDADFTAIISKSCRYDLVRQQTHPAFLSSDLSGETHPFECCLLSNVLWWINVLFTLTKQHKNPSDLQLNNTPTKLSHDFAFVVNNEQTRPHLADRTLIVDFCYWLWCSRPQLSIQDSSLVLLRSHRIHFSIITTDDEESLSILIKIHAEVCSQ